MTLCYHMDCSLPSSSLHRIVQARIREWVAIFYSKGSSQPRDQTQVFCVSCIGKWILYHYVTCEAPQTTLFILSLIFHWRARKKWHFQYQRINLHHLENVITKIIIICNDWLKKSLCYIWYKVFHSLTQVWIIFWYLEKQTVRLIKIRAC